MRSPVDVTIINRLTHRTLGKFMLHSLCKNVIKTDAVDMYSLCAKMFFFLLTKTLFADVCNYSSRQNAFKHFPK